MFNYPQYEENHTKEVIQSQFWIMRIADLTYSLFVFVFKNISKALSIYL